MQLAPELPKNLEILDNTLPTPRGYLRKNVILKGLKTENRPGIGSLAFHRAAAPCRKGSLCPQSRHLAKTKTESHAGESIMGNPGQANLQALCRAYPPLSDPFVASFIFGVMETHSRKGDEK